MGMWECRGAMWKSRIDVGMWECSGGNVGKSCGPVVFRTFDQGRFVLMREVPPRWWSRQQSPIDGAPAIQAGTICDRRRSQHQAYMCDVL